MVRRPRFVCEETADPNGPAPADIFTSGEIPWPDVRPLNVYAFDPSVGRFVGNYMTASVRYEELKPGPVGERFAVIDYDGTSKTFYTPVDLDDPKLLVAGGLAPSETDPRFHQQMVYAVASETLQRFESALGRRIHWRSIKGSHDSAPEYWPSGFPMSQSFSARDVPGQCLLQSRRARHRVRLFQGQPHPTGAQSARPDGLHLPVARHHRP